MYLTSQPPTPKYEPYLIIGMVMLIIFVSCMAMCNRSGPVTIFPADSAQYYKNKYGQEVAFNKTIVATVEDLQKNLQDGDTLVSILKKQVTRQTQDITVYKATLRRQEALLTNSVTGRDTIRVGDTIYVYPEYSAHKEDAFVEVSITANSDTTTYSFSAINYPVVEQKWKREGFLGLHKTLYTEVTNSNPYIHTDRIQSFQVTKKPGTVVRVLTYAAFVAGGFYLGRR